MNDLLHFDLLADLGTLCDAARQLLEEGWVSPRDLFTLTRPKSESIRPKTIKVTTA